jgi:acyl transferase domain-containing protein
MTTAPLKTAAPLMTTARLIDIITKEIASVTGGAISDIDIEQPFFNMGIESLQAVAIVSGLNTKLKDRLATELQVTAMFDYPNVRALADFLSRTPETVNLSPSKHSQVDITEPIAIVGISCRFPGADSVDEFWKNLSSGVDSITEIPEGRPWLRAISKTGELSGRAPPYGGFLRDIDAFDNIAFGISSAEALKMDPQQRLLLESSWLALEDAGLSVSKMRGSRTGVYIGISSSDYSILGATLGAARDIYDATGNAHSIASNRISYTFDLRGPSVSVDTACSSSLVAIHQACQALKSGEADYALAGGVNLILAPSLSIAFAQAQMLSPDGRCKTFSDEANGYVRGEGVGILVLKRLSDAERDADKIVAVVRGSAVNQDGRSSGLTAPSGLAQESVLRAALKSAGLESQHIDFIEAHGTGTPLGDPIEFSSLQRVYGNSAGRASCWVGSVKTNIGHLEAAAGVAGVIKSAMALKHRYVPKSLHFHRPNPKIQQSETLRVATQSFDLSPDILTDQRPFHAGVSSFGFGGTNAHIILQEYTPTPKQIPVAQPKIEAPVLHHILCFSASSEAALKEMALQFQELLQEASEAGTKLLCKASLRDRCDLPLKLAVHGGTASELSSALREFVDSPTESRGQTHWAKARVPKKFQPQITFLFTGQGSQSVDMGMKLYDYLPTYQAAFELCCSGFDRYFEKDLYSVTRGQVEGGSKLLMQTDYGQAALFAHGYALARVLIDDYNLKPDLVCGHSLGEVTAACIANALPLRDAIHLVAHRGRLMQTTAAGSMLVIFTSQEIANDLLEDYSPDATIAAINGPQSIVISGTSGAVDAIEEKANLLKLRVVRLRVERAFHSSLMDPILPEFTRAIQRLSFSAPEIPIISGLHGRSLDMQAVNADYWTKHLREPTRFYDCVQALESLGTTAYIEVGSHPTLLPLVQSGSAKSRAHSFALQNRQKPQLETLYHALSEMLVTETWRPEPGPRMNGSRKLPKTHFQKNRFWAFGEPPGPQTIPATAEKPEVADMNENREAIILNDIQSLLGRMLEAENGGSQSDVNVDEVLVDLGADSLLLLNAVQTIKDKYHVSIPISDLFQELSTLRKIATFIAANEAPPATPSITPGLSIPNQTPRMSLPQIPLGGQTLQDLIQQQLHLMNLQLQILNGQVPSGAVIANAEPGTSLPPSTKGVLGNFSTRANREAMTMEDEKKNRYLNDLIARFTKRTPKTKDHTQKYRKALADNRVSAGFRPNTKEMVYPIICHKAKGSRFSDFDGNEYIDFSMGFGVNLFGHSPDFIESAIREQIDLGMAVGPQSDLAGPVAQAMLDLIGHERVTFCNSGTEAVMTAIRLARAATGRERVVIFDGSYHGHFDGVLARPDIQGQSRPVASGITKGFVSDLLVLDYGTSESLEIIRREASNLAAVLVESVQSRFPEHQPAEFLRELRKITETSGTAFIFDEVITGFRIHPGGAQKHFGVHADLASYGKILGGGMPIGAVAGKSRFMDAIDGGHWNFGDSTFPQAEMTFFAGTFCKHPLAMAAAMAVLKRLKKDGDKILGELNERTRKLCAELNAFFKSRQLDLQANCFGSLFRFKAAANLDLFFYNLNLRGIYVWEGRNLFLSTAHSDADVQAFVDCVKATTDELVQYGFLKKKTLTNEVVTQSSGGLRFALLPSQQRFQLLTKKGEVGEAASHICLSVKMKGELSEQRLRKSLETVISHYDAFRLRFDIETGEQWFAKLGADLPLETRDLTREEIPWDALKVHLERFGQKPFDLKNEMPIRFFLAPIVEETTIFGLVCHHIALDGWSIAQFLEDVSKVYTALEKGQSYELAETMSFAKYLAHPEKLGSTKKTEAARIFWENKFAKGPLDPLRLTKKPSSTAHDGQRVIFDIEYGLYTKVKKTAKEAKVTPFMLMLAVFSQVLHELSGRHEFVVGTPAANRDLEGADKMLGDCANILPVLLEIRDGETIMSRLARIKSDLLPCYQNMIHPYEEMQKKAGGPLFNVSFNVEPASELPSFGDVSLFMHPFPITASEFDLTVNLTDLEYFYHGEADFKVALFSDLEVTAWMDRFTHLLKVATEAMSSVKS